MKGAQPLLKMKVRGSPPTPPSSTSLHTTTQKNSQHWKKVYYTCFHYICDILSLYYCCIKAVACKTKESLISLTFVHTTAKRSPFLDSCLSIMLLRSVLHFWTNNNKMKYIMSYSFLLTRSLTLFPCQGFSCSTSWNLYTLCILYLHIL